MSKHELPGDVVAQKIARILLIAQFVILLPVVIISFTRFASASFFMAFLAFAALIGMVGWLYLRYQDLPVVKEKNKLQREINELKPDIQREDARIGKAQQMRDHLLQSEGHEMAAALKKLQEEHVNNGLAQALISNATILGIGPKLKERMAAYGIHSAADVNTNSITRIDGFGTIKTQAVLLWRKIIQTRLEFSQPTSLPVMQEKGIKDEFHVRQVENDEVEQKARHKKDNLETKLRDLLPVLESLSNITFLNYGLSALAPTRSMAGFVATAFLMVQVFSGLSATTGVIANSIPAATATQAVDIAALQATIKQTVIAGITQSAPTNTLPAPTFAPTAIAAWTFTDVPILLQPSTALPAVLPVVPVSSSGDVLTYSLIDIGQGDAALIRTPDGQTMLIDGGDSNTGLVAKLQSLGVQRIDVMVATHPHADHIGGLVQVLQSFPVAKVVTSGEMHTTTTYERFLDGIEAAQAEYVEVKRGDVISMGGVDFKVISPVIPDDSNLNENSVVLQFVYGKTTFLLMGDAGADIEDALLSAGIPLKADILKVGHHGSKSSSTAAFLNAVQPKSAIYSAGINNQYGHPALQTINALTTVGATIYGTDKSGTISIKVDANGYTISTDQGAPQAAAVLPLSTATAPSVASGGGLEIVSVTSPISKGANASLTAKSSAGANCSIAVFYKSGASKAAGLGSKNADGSGMVSWSWKVGAKTTPGTWSISVTCNGVTKDVPFEVQ